MFESRLSDALVNDVCLTMLAKLIFLFTSVKGPVARVLEVTRLKACSLNFELSKNLSLSSLYFGHPLYDAGCPLDLHLTQYNSLRSTFTSDFIRQSPGSWLLSHLMQRKSRLQLFFVCPALWQYKQIIGSFFSAFSRRPPDLTRILS